jgi:hypothetical protein
VHCRVGDAEAAVVRLLACIEAIDNWLGSNRLKMNPEKTQFLWLGSRQQLSHIKIVPLHLHNGTIIVPSTSVRNLGVIFDSNLTMAEHVNNVTRACFYQLRQLRFIRHSLSDDAARMLVHAFIASKVDYCNALLFGATSHVTRKLQAVLNAAARLITGVRRSDHITPVLRDDLHWLPVEQRAMYKIALLVYKCLHGTAPTYLAEHCITLTTLDRHHQLRSTTSGDLQQARTRTHRFGPRSFRSSGPAVWNSLPPAIKDFSTNLNNFKALLKHHLFLAAYST